jgi:hypothetical protein
LYIYRLYGIEMWKIMRKQVKAFTFCTFSTEFFANFVHKPIETSTV